MRSLALLVFVVGAGTLGAEMAAARLLAPYFGDSTLIWANTIGVVLVSLSAGYWLGGRFADRHPEEQRLRLLVLVAAGLIAAIPLVSGPFLHLAVRAFDQIDAGAFVGSMLGMLGLIAVPLVLIGAVSPWALRLAVGDVEHAGRVAGRLSAIGTAGSLVGTWISSLLLIPFVGTQRTFLILALAIALVAALGLPRRALLAPAAIAALLALPPGVTKPAESGDRVLDEAETPYQYARIVEHRTAEGEGIPPTLPAATERRLELNEGQAIHSVWRADTVLTGNYWDAYLVLPFAVADAPPARVAMLGNAGGTVGRALLHYFPRTTVDGVEIDGKVSELGRKWLGMPRGPRMNVITEDARPFLRGAADRGRDAAKRYDVIGIDAYRQPYIPFYLTTREFFALAGDRLTARGSVIVNVGHPEDSDALEKALSATLRTTFPTVLSYRMTDTNTLLVATRLPASAPRLRAAIPTLPGELRPIAARAAGRLVEAPRGGPVYTDDKAPVEWLVDGSIVQYAVGD
ncbi:spermidine synthase [Patulibacter defluvii]|uniref:spermidine synthase n=1 Tax=Patulibacter defluvii TaxID=3095358 RepID=UPI002A754023|nr:fused MFS/spermidine synthase [Patulibacter sp. DM4]